MGSVTQCANILRTISCVLGSAGISAAPKLSMAPVLLSQKLCAWQTFRLKPKLAWYVAHLVRLDAHCCCLRRGCPTIKMHTT